MNGSKAATQAIDPSLVYPLPMARKFFGEKTAWLNARKNGLKDRIRYVGRRGFISGTDLIEFIAESGKSREYSNTTAE